MKITKLITAGVMALTLTACASQTNVPETVTETQDITSETLSETVTENIPETAPTSAVTTPAPEQPVTGESISAETHLSLADYDPRTADYITALTECEKFADILGNSADILITDLNDDGTPEIVMQIATAVGLSAVFSVKDGRAFMSEPAPGSYTPDLHAGVPSYSFDAGSLECYQKDGEKIFIADSFIGGSAGGTGGLVGITFDGDKTSSYEISRECISRTGTEYYWQGEKVSEENYSILWQEYMNSLEYSDVYTVRFPKTLRDSRLCSPMEYIAAGLEGFYRSGDLEMDRTQEMKPVFACVRTDAVIADCDNTAVLYDGFGNVCAVYRSSNGLTEYKNEYDESGRLCRVTESMRDVSIPDVTYEIDPEDSFEFDRRGYPLFTDNTPGKYQKIEYDSTGRIIKKTHIASEEIYSWGVFSPTVYAPEDFDPDSRVQAVTEYDYDTANRLVREEYTAYLQDGSDKSQHFIRLWEYDSEGRLLRYEGGDEYEYEIRSYNENGTPEKVTFQYEGSSYELDIKEHYHDLKGGVTCLWLSGSTPYRENMDCFIYFSPVRTADR